LEAISKLNISNMQSHIAQYIKKYTSILLILTLISIPSILYAETDTSNALKAIPVNESELETINLNDTQAARALYGGDSDSISYDLTGSAGTFASCAGLGAISTAIKSAITSALSRITGSILSFEAPVNDSQTRAKESGVSIFGVVVLPSWDQVGWCMVNSIIESIGDATVNWINSGFEGSPSFVDDPEQFFTDIADLEAASFLDDITGGLLCEPIKNIVKVKLTNTYNSKNKKDSCTFSEISGNLEQFMSGETFSWDDWISYTQDSQNNPFGATISGQIELNNRISNSLGIQSKVLDWSGGFLSKKDPETGKITSPGTIIQSQVNERLFSGQRRLEIADEFDEVVNALVNQLIKIAISEMTEATSD
jgi:hypothetical protein